MTRWLRLVAVLVLLSPWAGAAQERPPKLPSGTLVSVRFAAPRELTVLGTGGSTFTLDSILSVNGRVVDASNTVLRLQVSRARTAAGLTAKPDPAGGTVWLPRDSSLTVTEHSRDEKWEWIVGAALVGAVIFWLLSNY